MEEKSIFDQPQQSGFMQQTLPNATAVLVLGILSLIMCFVGLVLSIIALVLAKKDMRDYALNPNAYTIASYNNLKAGRICALIGLILHIVGIVVYAAIIIFAFSRGFNNLQGD